MRTTSSRYLRVHFMPARACVDISITEEQASCLSRAMEEHDDDISLEVTTHITAQITPLDRGLS